MSQLRFHVDTRLAFLLSENYRSTENAIKELVDNAWDADAERVKVFLPEPLTVNPEIIVEDDGTGMIEEELRREYLFIASDRRQRRGERTASKKRKVKGRKGIGKFAGLMTASTMKLETCARGICSSFSVTRDEFKKFDDIEGMPINLFTKKVSQEKHGTRIILSNLNQDLTFPNPTKLKQLLIQEYGREIDFNVEVNGKELGIDDVQGNFTEIKKEIPKVGEVNLQFTISNQKRKLRQPGIAIN